MPQSDSPVAAAVRAELARAGISGRQIARDLEWGQGPTARRLSGEVQFRVDELAKIAAYLGVPISLFVDHVQAAS